MVERFQHLFESLKEPVVVVDQDLRVTYANRSWLRLVGRSLSRVLGRNCYEFLDSQDPCPAEACAPEQVFKTGQPTSLACPDQITVEGRRRCTVSASPVVDDVGMVAEVILIYFFEPDPVGREAVHELDSSKADERRRMAQLNLIRDISRGVLSILDPDELLEHAARAIQRQFGYYFVCVLLTDPSEEYIVLRATSHGDDPDRGPDRSLRFRVGVEGITGHVAASGEPYVASSTDKDPLFIPDESLPDAKSELVVPIQVGQRVAGVLDIYSDGPDAFDDGDLFVAQSLAEQLAVGLENARLFAAEAERRREAETLQAATQALSSTLDLQNVFEVILGELQKVVPYDSASVQRLNGAKLEIIGGRGFPNLEELLGVSFSLDASDNPNRKVLESRTPLVLDDAPEIYPEFSVEPHAQAGIRSWLGVPLLFGNRLIGMIALDKQEPGFYSEAHARLAQAFAAKAAVALENATLFEATNRRVAELEAVRQASLSLTSSLELGEVLEAILKNTLALQLGIQDAHIFLYEDGELHFGSAMWADGRVGEPWAEPRSDGLTYAVAKQGKPIFVPDMGDHPLFKDTPGHWEGSIVGLPLRMGDTVVGVMTVAYQEPHALPEAEMNVLQLLADQAAVAIENARLFAAEHQSRLRLQSIQSTATALSAELHLDTLLEKIVMEAARAFNAEASSLMLWDEDRANLTIQAGHGLSEEYTARRRVSSEQFDAVVLPDKPLRPLYIPELADAPFGGHELVDQEGIRSVLVIPLGRQLPVGGILNVYSKGQTRAFSSSDIELAEAFAAQAAVMIENAELYQEARQRLRELTLLFETSAAISLSLGVDDVLNIVAENALAAAQAEISSVYLMDEELDLLVPKSVQGIRSDELHRAVFELGEGTIGLVAQTGKPLIVQDVSQDGVFDAKTEAAKLIHNTLTVPLAVKDRIIGTLEVCNKIGAEGFSATDEQLLTAFATQAAVTIENARLFQAEREQRELAEALRQAAAVVGSTLDLDQVLDHILEQVSRVLPSGVANVMIADGDNVRTVRWRGYEKYGSEGLVSSVSFRVGEAPALKQMMVSGKSIVIPDTERYPGWLELPGQEWLRSYAAAPIKVRDEVIGFLNVDSPIPGFFHRTHAERLEAFADQASLAIANARLYQEVRHHLEEVLILNEFTRAAISSLDLADVLHRGLSTLLGVRNFEQVHLLLVDEVKGELRPHEALDELFPHQQSFPIAIGEGLTGQVAKTGRALRVGNVHQDPNYIEGFPDTCSELCVPLQAGNRIIGVLDAQSAKPDAFTEGDERLLTTLAGLLSTVIENAHLFSQSQQRVRELTALIQVSQALNEARDLNTILDIVLEETFDLLQGHEGSVLLIDPPDGNRLRMVAERGLGADLMAAFNSRPVYTHEGTYKRALRSGRIVEVADTRADPDFLLDVGSRAEALTNVPLVTERGAIGLIAVDSLPQDNTTRRLLTALADMAAVAIEKERLRQETSDRLAEVTTLYTLATQIASSLSPETVMDSIVTILKLTLEPRACSIYLLDPTEEYVELVAGTGMSPSWKGVARLKVGEGVSGRVIAERRSVYVPDTHMEPDFIFFDPSVRSLVVVPLIVRDRAIGTLSIDDTEPNAFDHEVRLLTIAATQAAVAIENARLYESLQKSYTDLERAYEELRHLDQMKSEFVQNISHELRTPLTFIKGYVELLQDGDMGELNDDQLHAMNIVMTKADVLSRLVDDIISLQQAGRARSEFETISLADVGHAAVQAALASAGEVGITLQDEIPDGMPDVWGDRQRLFQVFDNLLGNALKFSNPGDTVTVRMFDEGKVVRTEVEDTGIGIPADQQSRIFDRFYQVDGTTTRRYGGTGLGLAIVKQILEEHRGEVGVKSEVDQGSLFYFTIPVADESPPLGG